MSPLLSEVERLLLGSWQVMHQGHEVETEAPSNTRATKNILREMLTRTPSVSTYRHVGAWVAPHVALHGLLEQLSTPDVGDEQRIRQAPGLEAGVHGTIVVADKDGLLDLLLLHGQQQSAAIWGGGTEGAEPCQLATNLALGEP